MSYPVPARRIAAFMKTALLLSLLLPWLTGCAGHLEPREIQPLQASTPLPDFPEPAPINPTLPEIQFTIQVGAFSTPERAARYMEQLQAFGLDAYYFIDTDGLSKVRFERFDTRESAQARAMALQSRGWIQDYFIARPRSASPAPGSPIPAPEQTLQQELVETARRFIGTAYRWGGSSAREGFDCSGLTLTVYRLNGLDLPRSSAAQYQTGNPVPRNALRGGDLVFFATTGGGRVSHVGIYSDQGRFIHAPGRGKYIRSASLTNPYFKSKYIGARRYY